MQISFSKFWTGSSYSMLIGTPTCNENKKFHYEIKVYTLEILKSKYGK